MMDLMCKNQNKMPSEMINDRIMVQLLSFFFYGRHHEIAAVVNYNCGDN